MSTSLRLETIRGLPSDPAILVRALERLGQPCRVDIDKVVFEPKDFSPRIEIKQLATANTSKAKLNQRWRDAFPSHLDHVRDEVELKRLLEKSNARLKVGDFTNFWWPLEKAGPDGLETANTSFRNGKQLAILRDALLPAFFEMYPQGRVLRISWDRGKGDYLAGLRILKKLQVIGYDQHALNRALGKNSMSTLGVNVVPELVHHALVLALAVLWPAVHGFAATIDNNHVLVFLLPQAFRYAHTEPAPLLQLAPTLFTPMADGVRSTQLLVDSAAIPSRSYPLDRSERYSADDLEQYLSCFVAGLDRTINWITDLANFGPAPGTKHLTDVDFDFAWHAYLTLYMLIGESIVLMGENRAFRRKMGLFDVVDLHAGLSSTSPSGATSAFKKLMSRDFSDSSIAQSLASIPGRVGQDLSIGLGEIRFQNAGVVANGILYGADATGVMLASGSHLTHAGFEVELLRALRNTKHGYAIRNAEIIAMHTGAIDLDFPDYAGALALNLILNHECYGLTR